MPSARPRLLDLFCGAGGAAMGYHMAGFDVIGVDINPSPHYPFEFIQRDVMDLNPRHIARSFAAVHASPPCQLYSVTNRSHMGGRRPHLDLVRGARMLLEETGLPWIIENVPGAPLREPVVLCGSSFGLRVRRHRLFECSFKVRDVPPCDHGWQDRHKPYQVKEYKNGLKIKASGVVTVVGHGQNIANKSWIYSSSVAMGIDWMVTKDICQAIPPLYTRFLGKQLMEVINALQ